MDLLADATKVKSKKILDHGVITLVDLLPRVVSENKTADSAVADAARVSYASNKTTLDFSYELDAKLINYLMRHKHTSPFEQVIFKFYVKLPMFVARQWVRHRTASINEVSARYSILPAELYKTSPRKQSLDNKQGSVDEAETGTEKLEKRVTNTWNYSEYVADLQHKTYLELTELNVARELARIHLPLSTYTEWVWTSNLHNIFHFLKLRLDKHAQKEIRVYAEAMYELISQFVPQCCEAFSNHVLNSVTFSETEMQIIKTFFTLTHEQIIKIQECTALSVRERRELLLKLQ